MSDDARREDEAGRPSTFLPAGRAAYGTLAAVKLVMRAAALLALHYAGKIQLDRSDYDAMFDVVWHFLEEMNNGKPLRHP